MLHMIKLVIKALGICADHKTEPGFEFLATDSTNLTPLSSRVEDNSALALFGQSYTSGVHIKYPRHAIDHWVP